MTFVPSDAPDWGGLPAGVRYLGSLDMSGNANPTVGTFSWSPSSYDGAVYVIPSGLPNSLANAAFLDITNVTLGVTTQHEEFYSSGVYVEDPFIGFVSAAMGASWRINAQVTSPAASTWVLYFFAVPTYPLVRIARQGLPMLVNMAGRGYRVPYDSMLFSTPAAGAQAIVTFPATAGARWVLDYASWTLIGHATAGTGTPRILDGVTTIFAQRLVNTVTDGSVDRITVGPEAGYKSGVNSALVVDFSAVPAATSVQAISAGAYLVVPIANP